MKKYLLASALVFSLIHFSAHARDAISNSVRSYFKLTTSNGLIVAVYNSEENRIDYVYPHIFANYDSAKYVHPFTGNIKPECNWKPVEAGYLKNTHVIEVKYENFTIYYFCSFTRNDKVFYAVIRGSKPAIEQFSFHVQAESGTAVHGLTLLETPLEDLPCLISGKACSGSMLKQYNDNLYEKYFLYSFTDSLHTDSTVIPGTLADLGQSSFSLVDQEAAYMQRIFSSCRIPKQITGKERDVVEQSISILKMSQVSDKEIFPFSHGQILASLRPGLWHIAWVRDGSYALQAMTRLGMYAEAKKGLEFMLKAPANRFKHYIFSDGKDYGPGKDYQISLTRYFGNGKEECDFNEFGPNIEYDDFGLFLIAFSDYVSRSGDSDFLRKWQSVVSEKVADVIIHCIDTNSLIKADSGPWEHHLQTVRQYTFTSAVCARGLEQYAQILEQSGFPNSNYMMAAERIKLAILKNMLCDNRFLKGNANDLSGADHEFYDAGVYEVFANGLFKDKSLFLSHIEEYDKVLKIKGNRPGFVRLNSSDPYENQEWVFINLRIALAFMLFGSDDVAGEILNHVTRQATMNYNTIPEMYSNKLQMEKVNEDFKSFNIWCNCIRDTDDAYIGTIPMVGYGSGVYILSLFEFYEKQQPVNKQ
ncbi:MAG: glycoside hydrolase family 15 protein [Bacteroidota bacterium]